MPTGYVLNMTFHIDAIYEGGVLRPLVPLKLEEHELVSLSITLTADKISTESEVARQRSVFLAYLAKVESQSDTMPGDGLSNRDHDRLIYGE
jgi:predicted DNA-binding antitoxin AbrB/MazE fold protein